jgi:hypothetical protein
VKDFRAKNGATLLLGVGLFFCGGFDFEKIGFPKK